MLVKHISGEEVSFDFAFVFEQIIAHVKEALFEIACVEIFGRDAIMGKFSCVLSETAAKVEKSVLRLWLFEEREDTRVAWLVRYGDVEESELADARIRSDSPCSVSLHSCQLGKESRGNSETDYFKDMGFDFIRRNVTVILKEFAACWAKFFNLFVVPRNVFGKSISVSLIFG